MTLCEALKKHERVRRKCWVEGVQCTFLGFYLYIMFNNKDGVHQKIKMEASRYDLLAEDWEEYKP